MRGPIFPLIAGLCMIGMAVGLYLIIAGITSAECAPNQTPVYDVVFPSSIVGCVNR